MGRPKFHVVDGKKPCSKCGTVLPFDAENFQTQPDKKTGRRILAHCRKCHNAASLAHHRTDKGRADHRVYQAKKMAEDPAYKARQRASDRRSKRANPGKYRALHKAWKVAHPGWAKAWRQANHDKIKVYNGRALAKRSKAPGHFTAADVQAQFNAQNGACFYCTKPLRKYHIEHKVPLSRGGTNWPDNIVCACASCNLRKGPRTADEFFAILHAEAA